MSERVVLALDTSTPAVTAGIVRVPDYVVLAERITVNPRAHAERLTPNAVAALAEAGLTMSDLDAVVVGCGPGPFTGLRAGMATAASHQARPICLVVIGKLVKTRGTPRCISHINKNPSHMMT